MTETNSSATHGHRAIFLLRRYMNRAPPFHSLLLTYCENNLKKLHSHFFKILIGLLQVFFGINADILCLHLDDTDLVAHLEGTELL